MPSLQETRESIESIRMVVMISNHDLDDAEAEIGVPCEQIFTPQSRHAPKRVDAHYCIDNGAFIKFDRPSFLSLLKREEPRIKLCRFVAVPDVVGDARRTLECFRHWSPILSPWPLALVCQNGQENLDIPWSEIAAIFMGGTTEWKMGNDASSIIRAAKIIGKWVHIGRVNSHGRFEHFERLGADSCDGVGLSRFPDRRQQFLNIRNHPKLNIDFESSNHNQ